MYQIKTSVRSVEVGINEVTVPVGANITGFISTGHGLQIVVAHADPLPDEVAKIIVVVLQVGGRTLELNPDQKIIHIGTLNDHMDDIFTAYGYEVTEATNDQ